MTLHNLRCLLVWDLTLRLYCCAQSALHRWTSRVLGILILLPLAACQLFPSLQQTPLAQITETPSASQPLPQASPTLGNDSIPTEASPGPITLRLWLPAQFDPSAGTPAGDILFARLRDFMNQNPGVRIEVRIKSSEGVGGLLESLVAANAAAPLALPDLIALPRPLLESAALKGLLYPFDGLTDVMDNENWYDYARQLAFIQESTFGLPFAGDAMLLAYRLVALDVPPRDWEAAVGLGYPLAFAAADPLALFTLTQYQALGGQIQDGQGRPTLDETTLTQVLTFYQQASQAGVMPVWLTQLETDEQVWQAFAEEQAPMASIWASSYFNGFPSLGFETTIAPQVTSDANTYTLASGWGWALASPDPDRRQMAAQLAEFLVDVQFLAEWDSAAGYLPPHIDALESWGDEQLRPLVGMISMSAQLVPPDELLASLGPALEEATVLVLKQQADPQNAAKIAAEQVNQP